MDSREYAFEGSSPDIDGYAHVSNEATVVGDVTIGPNANVWPGVVLRGDVVLECEDAPRTEDAADLRDERLRVGEVVGRDPARHGVERVGREREPLGVPHDALDAGKRLDAQFHHRSGSVHGDHGRDPHLDQRARGVAGPRRDVERHRRVLAPRREEFEVTALAVGLAGAVPLGALAEGVRRRRFPVRVAVHGPTDSPGRDAVVEWCVGTDSVPTATAALPGQSGCSGPPMLVLGREPEGDMGGASDVGA